MKVSDVLKEFKVTEDDLVNAGCPISALPNPYFKHIPMKMTYRHLVIPLVPGMKAAQPYIKW